MIYLNLEDGRQIQVTQHGSRIHVRECGKELYDHNRPSLDLFTLRNDELASMLSTYRKIRKGEVV